MTQRITTAILKNRLDILNGVFGYDREPYTRDTQGNLKVNRGTFVIDSAYGGHRLCQKINSAGGESSLSPRGTARETYDIINAWIDSAEQMRQAISGNNF